MTTLHEAAQKALEEYLCREMPAGTIISDPKWWAPKIAMAVNSALAQQVEPVASEDVLIDGVAYTVPAPVACELLRLHLEAAAPAAQPLETQVIAHDNCRAERQCGIWCGNSSCVSHGIGADK